MGAIGSPETSVSTHLTPRNSQEDGNNSDLKVIWNFKRPVVTVRSVCLITINYALCPHSVCVFLVD